VSRDRVVGKWSFKTFLRVDHKTTPNWAWPGSPDPISKYLDPPYNWQNIKGELQLYNKTANIKEKNLKVYNDV